MTIYVLLIILMSFILLIRQEPKLYFNTLMKNSVFTSISLVLFFIFILRDYSVGTDYKLYHVFFLSSPEQLNIWGIEKGYIFINTLAQNLNNFIIVSVIIYLIYFTGLYYLSKNINIDKLTFISLFVITYMYYYPFNGMRQMGAMGIVAFGYGLYIKNHDKFIARYVYLFGGIFLASFIHNSAYICIIYLLFEYININKFMIPCYAFLSLILGMTSVSSKISFFVLGFSSTYTQKYLLDNSLTFFTNSSKIGLTLMIIILIQFVFVYFYVSKVDEKGNNFIEKIVINGYLLLLMLNACTSVLLYRISWYFFLFQLLFSCLVFSPNNRRVSAFYKLLFFIFLLVLYFYELLYISNGEIVPYQLMK